MGIFDSYVESSQPTTEESLMEALAIISEAYLDSEEELDNVYEHYVIQTLEEGANLDMLKSYKAFAKQYNAAWKEVKKLVKAKDYDAALAKLNEIKGIISDAEKEVRSIDTNSISALVCGTLASFGIQMALYTLSAGYGAAVGSLISGVGKAAMKASIPGLAGLSIAGTAFTSLITLIRSFKELKSKKTENPKEAFNQTRQLILQAFKECNKAVADWEKAINKAKAKADK